ncbi:hypothetical protein [Thauera aromatica]|uniref:Uncharacterized protein n=1 Tax=Thauera aromatica K172 TaxID=44139 RepID=A0A2R4BP01_THAAR|nr:hypothetical protein [Thauera aromatica]AVR89058.1 hypothetical protein Tharo_2155 [Thauera aromatica K172]
MSTELDLDDVASQSNKAVAELAALRTELAILRGQIATAPRGISAEADFERMTWTFEIEQGCRVGGGTYALVCLPSNDQGKRTERSAAK